jgi:phage/plasmid primase-like uncharacterized protein
MKSAHEKAPATPITGAAKLSTHSSANNTAIPEAAQAYTQHGLTDAMHAAGVVPTDHSAIVLDGSIRRFHVEGDKAGSQNGWLKGHDDAHPNATFGTWKDGATHKWKPGRQSREPMTSADVSRIKAQKAEREQEQADKHASAANRAQRQWDETGEVDVAHPYLVRKNVKPYYAKQRDDALMFPIMDFGLTLHSLEYITPDGGKKFMPGGKVGGNFIPLRLTSNPERLLIAEGFATAATLGDAEPDSLVVAATSAGNMLPVAMAAREWAPGAEIVLCADAGAVGITKAQEAARACDGLFVEPDLPDGDFNDLAAASDIGAVRDALAKAAPLAKASPQSKPDESIKPFALPGDIGIGAMLDSPPPERRWLLDDLLPLGVVGMLAAGGGTGKSFLMMQMAIAVATGRPFLGMEVGEPGGVLMVAAEDEREELHRRLWRIVQYMRSHGSLDESDIARLRARLFIVPSVGVDNRLTAEAGRSIERTDTGERITALVEHLPPINLIVLDPVSRFRGGDENSNDAATRFVEAVEALRAATRATVLMPHHVSKQGLLAGADALSTVGQRGASALVDGVRWAAAMATLNKDEAKKFGMDAEDAGRYVRLDTVKNNYAAPWDGIWLERQEGGVLVIWECQLNDLESTARTARAFLDGSKGWDA